MTTVLAFSVHSSDQALVLNGLCVEIAYEEEEFYHCIFRLSTYLH